MASTDVRDGEDKFVQTRATSWQEQYLPAKEFGNKRISCRGNYESVENTMVLESFDSGT